MADETTVFIFGVVFLGSGLMYVGGGLRKLAALSGTHSTDQNRIYDRGIRSLEKRLRQSANAGDAYASSVLDDLAKIRDDIDASVQEHAKNAKKMHGTK